MPNEPWGATYADCVNSAARLVPSPAMLTPAVPISWADAVAANAAMATTGATRRNRELRIFLIELELTVTHGVRVERNRDTRRGGAPLRAGEARAARSSRLCIPTHGRRTGHAGVTGVTVPPARPPTAGATPSSRYARVSPYVRWSYEMSCEPTSRLAFSSG